MKSLITRRHLLTGAVRAAAVGAVVPWTARSAPPPDAVPTRGVLRIHWDPLLQAWPSRPAATVARVLFISTGDAGATHPADFDLELGDVWWRHPTCSSAVQMVAG